MSPPTAGTLEVLAATGFGEPFAAGRRAGRFGAARFDFGRAERFDFTRALERAFAFDFGRDERRDPDLRAAEARFFIFLGRRDLALPLERFPAMDRSFWGENQNSLT